MDDEASAESVTSMADLSGTRAPFPGNTGAGVRIAIIDSGVHPTHDHILSANLLPGVAVARDGGIERGGTATLDHLGHGTAVTAAIQQRAPEARCIPVRVFREGLRASAAALISAIEWSVSERADIINLSLGSVNPAHEAAFADAVRTAYEAGVVIIAPCEVQGQACYPGALPDVIGVGVDWDCPVHEYRLVRRDGRPIFMASGFPRAIEGVAPRRNLHGISFAVARVTGFAALARQTMPETGPTPTSEALCERLASCLLEGGYSSNLEELTLLNRSIDIGKDDADRRST